MLAFWPLQARRKVVCLEWLHSAGRRQTPPLLQIRAGHAVCEHGLNRGFFQMSIARDLHVSKSNLDLPATIAPLLDPSRGVCVRS